MLDSQAAEMYQQILYKATSKEEFYKAVVNAPFSDPVEAARLFLGIVVLLFANYETKMIDRVALSDTNLARGTVQMSVKKFEDIKIPLDYYNNIVAEAIHTQEPQQTTDWRYLFEPALSPEEARFNQAGGGISYSAVHPLTTSHQKGALIFSFYQYAEQIEEKQRQFMRDYTSQVAICLHNLEKSTFQTSP